LNGHEQGIDDTDRGGEQGNAAEDGEDDEDDVEEGLHHADRIINSHTREIEFFKALFDEVEIGFWVEFGGGEHDAVGVFGREIFGRGGKDPII